MLAAERTEPMENYHGFYALSLLTEIPQESGLINPLSRYIIKSMNFVGRNLACVPL